VTAVVVVAGEVAGITTVASESATGTVTGCGGPGTAARSAMASAAMSG
jgi:hypothetical protein